MLTKLKLQQFKNFADAKLQLGELTLLVGTNASGKSNLRDAFRFLHGVSRGYSLADIIGGKYGDGGYLEWRGIRGGTRDVAYRSQHSFALQVSFAEDLEYGIEVELDEWRPPRILREHLRSSGRDLFNVDRSNPIQRGVIVDPLSGDLTAEEHPQVLILERPFLTQFGEDHQRNHQSQPLIDKVIAMLGSMRFLDLAPDSMRLPSLPGQIVLGDRGENLSSVLQAICKDDSSKKSLLGWIKELTPIDVVDFEFIPDQTGKILVSLVEAGGRKTSAYSASDGTLRFLAMIAALLGPSPAALYFFEELENGIHPTRLHLLLQLIEQRVRDGKIQVVATSHSPQLLGFLGEKARDSAAVVYRLKDRSEAEIRRIMDIPHAREVLKKQNLSRLHESGWLEDAIAFTREPQDDSPVAGRAV